MKDIEEKIMAFCCLTVMAAVLAYWIWVIVTFAR